jgi:hypothetical protein
MASEYVTDRELDIIARYYNMTTYPACDLACMNVEWWIRHEHPWTTHMFIWATRQLDMDDLVRIAPLVRLDSPVDPAWLADKLPGWQVVGDRLEQRSN